MEIKRDAKIVARRRAEITRQGDVFSEKILSAERNLLKKWIEVVQSEDAGEAGGECFALRDGAADRRRSNPAGKRKKKKETGPHAIFARGPVRRSYGCRNNVRGPSRRRRSLVCRRSTTASLSHEKVRRHGIGSDNFTHFRAA
jgi:hypothetical protein